MLSELIQLFLSLSLDFLQGFIVGGLVGVFLTGLLAVYFYRKYSNVIKNYRRLLDSCGANYAKIFKKQEQAHKREVRAHEREVKRLKEEITELYLRLGELR